MPIPDSAPSSSQLDPRTPVIVGVGQVNDRGTDADPVVMMTTAVQAAIVDAGAPTGLAGAIDQVRVPWGVWPYADPGRLVAHQIGATDTKTTKTTVGGNQVYDLLVDSAPAPPR